VTKVQNLFLHSSFRTASTWLWAKFRQESVVAFCEPFNEFLADVSPLNIRDRRPESWASGHPQTEPYFVEYRPLIERVGVAGYHRTFAFECFFPQSGVLGDVSFAETEYLQGLERIAAAGERVAVFSFTRSLGRAAGMRRSMGGYHVFLYRPLLDQWLSYWSQYEQRTPYFMQTIGRTLDAGRRHSPMLEEISRKCWVGYDGQNNVCGFSSIAAAFESFLAIHLYLYSFVDEWADLCISARRLGTEPGYCTLISTKLREVSGIATDFSDASRRLSAIGNCDGVTNHSVDFVERLLARERGTQSIASKILGELRADIALVAAMSAERGVEIDRMRSEKAEITQELNQIVLSRRYRWADGVANTVNRFLRR
jgi:hypothetical protein